ncbi:T9SS type A sorting domain-containing protein [Dyadobacter luticola]|uniref:T9SS type A sorting domain-containing protein n=1 Tax=Dyadobacter luticola TaxID=1979387 RepID=A0A5R9L4V9_9BACT|nr:T9SS type A sorting domain-containing protein [Dyadobacter luticola]TLV03389.1 T9SS type A sorting domain-containing protein [Dyadobacter luticola]
MKQLLQKRILPSFIIFVQLVAGHTAVAQDPGDYVGDLNFTTQAEIDNFVDEDQYTAIVGNVTISGNDIVSFGKLKKIETIFGSISVVNNPNLTSFRGLDMLSMVWGNITIDQNPVLTDINALNHPIGMSGALQITGNSMLSNCAVVMICAMVGGSVSSRIMAPAISDNAPGCNFPSEIRTACSSLPVTLVSFEATKQEKTVLLNWATSSEVNSKTFDIQHSSTGKDWKYIGSLAAAGSEASLTSYSFQDISPKAGQNFYRLKMIDIDGTYAWSSIREVKMNAGEESETVIFPNPTTDKLIIQTARSEGIRSLQILDVKGHGLQRQAEKPNLNIDLKNLPAGIYTLKISMTDGSVVSRRFVKQ